MAKAKSRYSVARLESLIDKAASHLNGLHLKKAGTYAKTDPRKRGKVMSQKVKLALELTRRRNSAKARGG